MHLLTFERERPSKEGELSIREQLDADGIHWHWLKYHQRPSLPATLYDIAVGTVAALRICRKYGIGLVHARSHVPAAMALMLKRLLGCRFLFDIRGLLAEEYVDAGNWTRGGLKFRLTKQMERIFFREADAFVMLTHRIKEELVKSEPALCNRADDIQVIPCCAYLQRFSINPQQRTAYRRERGWAERRVLTYVGKLGTWYLADEMAQFFATARKRDSRFFFQVLTQSDSTAMQQKLETLGVSHEDYDIRFSPPHELPLILFASDASISFRKGEYSRLAASPTKVGESLGAGLPLVTNAGIGDCDNMLKAHRLGTITQNYSDAEYQRAIEELCLLLEDVDTPQRCRQFAEKELSLSGVGGPRYATVYERLLGSANLAELPRIAEISYLKNES
jgi:glycosyltransferase involved in cell wall biosynthesis